MDFNRLQFRRRADTGARTIAISNSVFEQVSAKSSTSPSLIKLTAYSGHTILILGVIDITLKYNECNHVLGKKTKASTFYRFFFHK